MDIRLPPNQWTPWPLSHRFIASMGKDVNQVWTSIEHVIMKTLIAAVPALNHMYNVAFPLGNDGFTCFQLLGFDILFDQKFKPWVLEVNQSPSLHIETPIDERIKTAMLKELFAILNVSINDKEKNSQVEQDIVKSRLLVCAMGRTVPDGRSFSSGLCFLHVVT